MLNQLFSEPSVWRAPLRARTSMRGVNWLDVSFGLIGK
jgi:hypothetical protein